MTSSPPPTASWRSSSASTPTRGNGPCATTATPSGTDHPAPPDHERNRPMHTDPQKPDRPDLPDLDDTRFAEETDPGHPDNTDTENPDEDEFLPESEPPADH